MSASRAIFAALFCLASIAVVVSDIKTMRIPDIIVLPSIIGMLILLLTLEKSLFLERMLSGTSGFIIMYIFYNLFRSKLGFGDVKYSAFMGVFLGLWGWYVAIVVASLTGIVFFLGLKASGHRNIREVALPFSPFLFAGSVISFFLTLTVLDFRVFCPNSA